MVSRVRIDAHGGSAAEVEKTLHLVADTLDSTFGWVASRGEQVIQRELAEPDGHTAHSGRLVIHPNVASDSGQVAFLESNGVEVTKPYWSADDAKAVGGVPHM